MLSTSLPDVFQRRLNIEGDTELGLFAKNLLDSTDWSGIPRPLIQALAQLVGK
jgi:predicted lipid carrier protein YhbT